MSERKITIDVTRKAVDEGRAPPPRLLYTGEELREVRKLRAIAVAERAETANTREASKGGGPA